MPYRRHNRVLIGGRSRNLGGHNILVSKPKGSDSDTPVALNLTAAPVDSSTGPQWNLTATWIAPSGVTPTGYQIERQRLEPSPQPWANQQPTPSSPFVYANQPEGIYQVRLRTTYAGGPSTWVISNTVYAFINVSYDFSGNPQFHTMTLTP